MGEFGYRERQALFVNRLHFLNGAKNKFASCPLSAAGERQAARVNVPVTYGVEVTVQEAERGGREHCRSADDQQYLATRELFESCIPRSNYCPFVVPTAEENAFTASHVLPVSPRRR